MANCTVMMMMMFATKYESRLKTNTNSSKDVQEEEVCTRYNNFNCNLYSNDDDSDDDDDRNKI